MRRYIYLITIMWCLSFVAEAQFCTGSLGDNIFLEGNFGNGSANLLSPNPNVAPGYSYTFNVPPIDGEYVITNSTASWPLWPTWLAIGDNSSDSDGYMMVVNASNEPGLFYEQTVSGLCDNTLYEFSADIINLIKAGTPDHIDPDVSFLLDGLEFFTTGNIDKTNTWTTYGFTFTTSVGQESLTLSLQNNAPGGNGNDLALDNISFRACGPETMIEPDELLLCEEDSAELQAILYGNQYVDPVFQWQQSFDEGFSWEDITGASDPLYFSLPLMAGTYYYRFLVADGTSNLNSENCRVNSGPKTITVLAGTSMQSATLCEGNTFMIGNSVYSTSGIYMDTLANILGCDSIVTTELSVFDADEFVTDIVTTIPCPNATDGSIALEVVSGGTPPYTYIFDGMDFGTTSLFTDLAGEQTYLISILDANGCSTEVSVFLENPSDLFLDLGENQVVELGETIELSPSYNFTPSSFNWQSFTPIDCLDFEDCDVIEYQPTISQTLGLELFANNGCSISDSIFIEVQEVRNVWLANAFSPNGDGFNDYFTVFGSTSNVELVEAFKIFDRWGILVFETNNFLPNDFQNGWDGTFRGKPLVSGVFVYTASVRFIDGQVLQYSGDVVLVK